MDLAWLGSIDFGTVIVAMLGIAGTIYSGALADRRARARANDDRQARETSDQHARDHQDQRDRTARSQATLEERKRESREAARVALGRVDALWKAAHEQPLTPENGYILDLSGELYDAAYRAARLVPDATIRELVTRALQASRDVHYATDYGYINSMPFTSQYTAIDAAVDALEAHIRGDAPDSALIDKVVELDGEVEAAKAEHHKAMDMSYRRAEEKERKRRESERAAEPKLSTETPLRTIA